jgi:hypothetical protein
MCGTSSVAPSRWMAAHTVARSREMAALPPMAARVPADWKSAVKVMMAVRLPAQKAPADWRLAVKVMMAVRLPAQKAPVDWRSAGDVGGERHPLSCGIFRFLAKTAA